MFPDTCIYVWLHMLMTTGSLLTTKRLLDHGFHFPMHIALLHLITVLAIRLAQWIFRHVRCPAQLQRSYSQCSKMHATSLLYTLCASAALLCGYQAIHHVSNLPVVVMISGLDWQSRLLPIATRPDSTVHLAEMRVYLMIGVILIFAFDLRPSLTGIGMSVLAAIFSAMAQSLQNRIETNNREALQNRIKTNDREETLYCICKVRSSSVGPFTLSGLDLMGAMITAVLWGNLQERQYSYDRPHNPMTFDHPTLAMNIAFTALSTVVVATPCPTPGLEDQNWPTNGDLAHDTEHLLTQQIFSSVLVCLVTIGSHWSAKVPSTISPWQLLGFFIASLDAKTMADCRTALSGLITWRSPWPSQDDISTGQDAGDTKECGTHPCWIVDTKTGDCGGRNLGRITSVSFLCIVSLLNTLFMGTSESSSGVILDKSFLPRHPLDIVVARYDEKASEVARHIGELLSLSPIKSLDPRVVIYNKESIARNSTAFKLDLQQHMSTFSALDVTVRDLENVGRESDTYLEHISSHWNDLANHTIFIQASVHYAPTVYLRHLQDYFIPSTGFLSLAPSGFCKSCDICFDHDWTETPGLLQTIFGDFNHGAECKDVVLTYRGQFVASAARIRGNELGTYRRWLDELRQPQGFLHTPPYTESVWSRKNDSMSAPRIGFTLERLWGTMLQCNQRRIAHRCPSLLSPLICPPIICGKQEPGDCQCLDY